MKSLSSKDFSLYCMWIYITYSVRSNISILFYSKTVFYYWSMVFPVVMYGCESWTIKKAEHRKIDAFELWCWRRLLRVPWTARRSNQSILKEISPGYSLEGLMLKLKLWHFDHLLWRASSLEKTLMLGKIKGRRRRWQSLRWLDGITASMDMNLSKPQEIVEVRGAQCATVHGVTKSQAWLSDKTVAKTQSCCLMESFLTPWRALSDNMKRCHWK